MQKQRRDFLKITAAGAAGLVFSRGDRAFAAWPSTGTLPVNPTIDNMRVVACYDTKMMKSVPVTMTFANENAVVNSAQVQANMDAMAMQLANQTTADAAWKAIFRTGKTSWAATKVAIKVNTISSANMARVAIVQKFCNILAGLGVLPANIIIYDGQSTYTGGTSLYTTYFSTTDTTKTQAVVSNQNSALGGTTNATIPGGSSATCTADIANGVIDILIDIANNKGHSLAVIGGATLCMKNHFGTFAPKHDLNYMFNINKSDAILGGTPVRQQLCFVDSLIANKVEMSGTPEVMPCYLIMGTFAPAVDYLTIKKVREAVMGCTHNDATIDSYLTTFGYATTDPVWVVVPPAGSGSADGGAGGASGSGGTSGAGGVGSGGTSAAGGARNGGTSGSGGVASGGTSGAGGVRSGGTSAAGGAGSGGTSAGAASGGSSGAAGAGSGGSSGAAGAGSGGTTAAGGATGSGGATSGGAGGTGGAATSSASASGGSATTGGTRAGGGTGGSGGSKGSTAGGGKQEGGCDVAGADRRVTRWGTMLAFGAVVAEKLRRLVSGSDRSS